MVFIFLYLSFYIYYFIFHSALGAAALDGKLYVCGGFDGISSLDTVECYNKDTNRSVDF